MSTTNIDPLLGTAAQALSAIEAVEWHTARCCTIVTHMHTLQTHVEQDWLTIELTYPEQSLSAYNCLLKNTGLPCGVRYCLDPELRLRVDVYTGRLPRSVDLNARAASAARAVVESVTATDGPVQATVSSGAGLDPQSLIEESGWAFEQRADATAVFPIDAERGIRHALLNAEEATLWMPIGSAGKTVPPERDAIAIFLLRATASIRAVRAVVREHHQVGLEVVLPGDPTGADLAQALEALLVACDACAAEVTALLDDAQLAAAYLDTLSETDSLKPEPEGPHDWPDYQPTTQRRR